MNYQHILAAMDFSPESDKVVQRASESAAMHGASLTLLHVVEPIYSGFVDEGYISIDMNLEQDLIANAKRRLQETAQQFGLTDSNLLVEAGSPKHTVVSIAQELGVDLIIAGSHGRHGLQLLLGSTANGILHLAQCDVLAVRVREQADEES